jgi:hypothetical protein
VPEDLRPPDPPLSDDVVTLRPISEGDVPLMEELHRDPEVVRWEEPEGEFRFPAAEELSYSDEEYAIVKEHAIVKDDL